MILRAISYQVGISSQKEGTVVAESWGLIAD
jgi:hypothetical protein